MLTLNANYSQWVLVADYFNVVHFTSSTDMSCPDCSIIHTFQIIPKNNVQKYLKLRQFCLLRIK